MPYEIRNEELYHDRTIQDWHRATFGKDAWAIDLDLVGVCKRCRHPLFLIEGTTNPDKSVSILKRMASLMGIPAILARHAGGEIVRATVVSAASPQRIGDAEALASYLSDLRLDHHCRERVVA